MNSRGPSDSNEDVSAQHGGSPHYAPAGSTSIETPLDEDKKELDKILTGKQK